MRRFLFVIISLLSLVMVKAQEPNSGVSQQNVFHGEIVSKEMAELQMAMSCLY